MSWLRDMSGAAVPPAGLAEWATGFSNAGRAWAACDRPDWLVWLAAHVPLSDDEQRKVLRATEAIEPLSESPLAALPRILSPFPTTTDVARRFARSRSAQLEVTDWLPSIELAFILSIVLIVVAKLKGATWAQTTAMQFGIVVVGTVVATIVLGIVRSAGYAARLRSITFDRAFASLYDRAQGALRDSAPDRIRNLTVITRSSLSFVSSKLHSHS